MTHSPAQTKERSGVDWIGDIPTTWDVARVRYVAKLESGHTPSRNVPEYWEACKIPWFTLNDVWQLREGRRYVFETVELISDLGLQNSSARLLPKGTVILSRTASIGFVGILGRPMATTQDFVNWICGPRLRPEYLYYVFQGMREELRRVMRGSTHQTIYMSVVQQLSTPLPPLSEQEAIATFLDRETARIDALVEKKRRLLGSLEEKRLAVITHAVTKGLDPNAVMKDSGVEWIGDVPASWHVLPLRRVLKSDTRNGLYKKSDQFSNDGVPFLQMGEAFAGSVFRGPASDRVRVTKAELATWGVERGDLIFARRSLVFEGSGKCSMIGEISEPHVFESSMIRVRVDTKQVLPEFALAYFMSNVSRAHILSRTKQVTISGIDSQQLKALPVVLPDLNTQKQIASYLNVWAARNASMANLVQETIRKLHEYRSALITNAVTGKIDVRRVVEKEAAA